MMRTQTGFAVLASAIILSLASIVYTANLAQSQLVDNQVLANHYRNKEAFVNADSGVNLILSKLNNAEIAEDMLPSLPFTFPEEVTTSTPYQVSVERVATNRLQISSSGRSLDGSAAKEISLQVYYAVSYDIPISPITSDGKLNIDNTGTINDGCEGVSADECRSEGNIAEKLMISQPGSEQTAVEPCTGGDSSIGINSVATEAINSSYENDSNGSTYSSFQQAGLVSEVVNNDWGPAHSSEGTVFENADPISDMNNAESLFESMFGVTLESGKEVLDSSGDVMRIDMTNPNAVSCSEQLKEVDDETTVIYIKGDCNIDQNDASHSATSENQRFTIGSPDNPKMVFIEGGTFITQPNTGASVIGMLYFLPSMVGMVDADGNPLQQNGELLPLDKHGDPLPGYEQGTEELASVDMGGIRVNGALLSEYQCSHDGYDKTDSTGSKQHFSARYDKTVLNNLYGQLGMDPEGYSYQLVEGTWRDF